MRQLKPVPHGLLQAFRAYESALMSDDVAALIAAVAGELTAIWSIAPVAALLSQSAPRFTFRK